MLISADFHCFMCSCRGTENGANYLCHRRLLWAFVCFLSSIFFIRLQKSGRQKLKARRVFGTVHSAHIFVSHVRSCEMSQSAQKSVTKIRKLEKNESVLVLNACKDPQHEKGERLHRLRVSNSWKLAIEVYNCLKLTSAYNK